MLKLSQFLERKMVLFGLGFGKYALAKEDSAPSTQPTFVVDSTGMGPNIYII